MASIVKRFQKLLRSPNNVRFSEFVAVILAFGFILERVSGSHHIFAHPDIEENVNVQNEKGKAKSYQVRQFLKLVERYNLQTRGDEK